MTPLLKLTIQSPRDILMARLRTRQISKLLGFEWQEAAKMACVVFELAYNAWKKQGPFDLVFEEKEKIFRIFMEFSDQADLSGESSKQLQLTKPLPKNPQFLSAEDFAWVLKQIHRLPVRLFEEIRQLNREMLELFLDTNQEQKPFREQRFSVVPRKAA